MKIMGMYMRLHILYIINAYIYKRFYIIYTEELFLKICTEFTKREIHRNRLPCESHALYILKHKAVN